MIRIRKAGENSTRISRTKGVADEKLVIGVWARETISTIVKTMATGKVKVPTRSIMTTNCIEKQKVPHRLRTRTSSNKLWIVELIHRRRWDSKTLNSSGTIVLQIYIIPSLLISGNLFFFFSFDLQRGGWRPFYGTGNCEAWGLSGNDPHRATEGSFGAEYRPCFASIPGRFQAWWWWAPSHRRPCVPWDDTYRNNQANRSHHQRQTRSLWPNDAR